MPGQTSGSDGLAAVEAWPSMEGRTIARPDLLSLSATFSAAALQWRAGQLPGQTVGVDADPAGLRYPSMEGRAIARPDSHGCSAWRSSGSLQWRAGQLPGQTVGHPGCGAEPHPPSMEGRTIARPDPRVGTPADRAAALQWRAGQLPGQTVPPAAPRGLSAAPSMEGRTIARPDPWRSVGWSDCKRTFNGGPDNCPARPAAPRRHHHRNAPFNGGPDNCPARPVLPAWLAVLERGLQWRAGQLPGQTPRRRPRGCRSRSFNGGPDNCPARPGFARADPVVPWSLQWRAGQLPGQTASEACSPARRKILQWRAGQLPGQTGASSPTTGWARRTSFNGGPDNCPARQREPGVVVGGHVPSMEGRTIARPDGTRPTWGRMSSGCLQWRAGQLPGQTRRSRGCRRSRRRSFNGGPDNCPARPGRVTLVARQLPCAFNGGPDNCPARPRATPQELHLVLRTFNGGPDNCPARLCGSKWAATSTCALQWRAGQLPGQTPGSGPQFDGGCAFNGGPDNCPARQEQCGRGGGVTISPSMEGRTIARPDANGSNLESLQSQSLQWRAGQLPGQTTTVTQT